jgi:hypothetical protein
MGSGVFIIFGLLSVYQVTMEKLQLEFLAVLGIHGTKI